MKWVEQEGALQEDLAAGRNKMIVTWTKVVGMEMERSDVKYILKVNPMSIADSLDPEVRQKVTPQFLTWTAGGDDGKVQ